VAVPDQFVSRAGSSAQLTDPMTRPGIPVQAEIRRGDYVTLDDVKRRLAAVQRAGRVSFERIHWTMHALRRLQERAEISDVEVEAAIRVPDQVVPDTRQPGRWIAQKLVDTASGPMLLRVVSTDAGGGEASVLSFYRTTQVARYWRTDL
jgi:hypothetical protein